jgi:hypothetical protein
MAGEATSGTNGQSMSYEQAMAADRAAFLAGEDADAGEDNAAAAVAEDDSDLDGETADDGDELEAAASDDDESEEKADEDEDAEEDDDEDSDLDDEKAVKVDADTAKRLEQVKRTDRRLREQREKLFSDRERQLSEREQTITSRLAEAEKFEKLKGRGFLGMIEHLAAELGASEDDIDLAAKKFYAMSKAGKSDPKWKATVDALQKERERDEELKSVKKRLEEQETERKQAELQAEGRRNAEAFIGKAEKLVVADKHPLAKHLLETNPDEARGELFIIANRLAEQQGRLPDHKAVVIEFEKQQRRVLRRFGIDPRSFKPAAGAKPLAAAPAKTAPKVGDKKTAAKPKQNATDDRPLTKADFIAATRSGKYE